MEPTGTNHDSNSCWTELEEITSRITSGKRVKPLKGGRSVTEGEEVLKHFKYTCLFLRGAGGGCEDSVAAGIIGVVIEFEKF